MKTRVQIQIQKIRDLVHESKNFFLIWIAQVLTQTAVSVTSILIGILSHEGTLSIGTKNSSAGIGIIVALANFPDLIISPFAGVFADWMEKKKIMIYSNLIRFVILIFFVLANGWQNLGVSYLLVFLLSLVLEFFIPAEGGLIPQIVDKKYMLLANSLFSLTVYSTMAVGVAFSGVILNILGIRFTFIICAFLFLVSTILLRKVNFKEKVREARIRFNVWEIIKDLLDDMKKGLSYAFKKKILRFALVHLFLLQIIALTLITIVFRIGEEIYGVSSRTAGVVVFAPMVAGLVAGLAILNTLGRKRNRVRLIWFGSILSLIGFTLMAMVSIFDSSLSKFMFKQTLSTLSLCAVGGAMPFLLIPAQTLLHENTEDEFRGRILGIWLALTSACASMIAVSIGFLADRVGDIFIAIVIISILSFFYSIILYYLLRKKKL